MGFNVGQPDGKLHVTSNLKQLSQAVRAVFHCHSRSDIPSTPSPVLSRSEDKVACIQARQGGLNCLVTLPNVT